MDGIVAIIGALGGAATAVLSGLALLVKARSVDSVQMNVVRRLMDWLEQKDLAAQLPDGLRRDVRRLLGRPETGVPGDRTDPDSTQQGASE